MRALVESLDRPAPQPVSRKVPKCGDCTISLSFFITVAFLVWTVPEVKYLAEQSAELFSGGIQLDHQDEEFHGRLRALEKLGLGNNYLTRTRSPKDTCGAQKVLDVTDAGATGDGVTDDTEAITRAIRALANNPEFEGQPTHTVALLFPQEGTFSVTHIVFNVPGMIVCVQGRIVAHSRQDETQAEKFERKKRKGEVASYIGREDVDNCPYVGANTCPEGFRALSLEHQRVQMGVLTIRDTQNVIIAGGGEIDGRGKDWWDIRRIDRRYYAPVLVRVMNSTNIYLGHLSLTNSPFYHVAVVEAQYVMMEYLTIRAPAESPNTDGVTLIGASHVTLKHSHISTGDDNVAIKEGSSHVTVEMCHFGGGHGTSIGSLGENATMQSVKHVMIRDSLFSYTRNVARVKTWQGGSGEAYNITYGNLHVHRVHLPIMLDQFYCPESQHPKPCFNYTSNVAISHVAFQQISGTHTSGLAGSLLCSDDVPCTDIRVVNVKLRGADPGLTNDFQCWAAKGQQHFVEPRVCLNVNSLPEGLGAMPPWSPVYQVLFFVACMGAFLHVMYQGAYQIFAIPLRAICNTGLEGLEGSREASSRLYRPRPRRPDPWGFAA